MSIRQPIFKTQVIYGRGGEAILWATPETNEALVIVECVESGRLPIHDIRPYGPSLGPMFNAYDDELASSRPFARWAHGLYRAKQSAESGAARTPNAPKHYYPASPIGTAWNVLGSTGTYSVAVYPDSVNGGKYLVCSCPSWKFRRGQGQDCKHIIQLVKDHEGEGTTV